MAVCWRGEAGPAGLAGMLGPEWDLKRNDQDGARDCEEEMAGPRAIAMRQLDAAQGSSEGALPPIPRLSTSLAAASTPPRLVIERESAPPPPHAREWAPTKAPKPRCLGGVLEGQLWFDRVIATPMLATKRNLKVPTHPPMLPGPPKSTSRPKSAQKTGKVVQHRALGALARRNITPSGRP